MCKSPVSPTSNAHFVAPSVPQVLREISVVGVWCNLYIFTAAVKVRFIAIDNAPGYSVAGSAEIYYVLAASNLRELSYLGRFCCSFVACYLVLKGISAGSSEKSNVKLYYRVGTFILICLGSNFRNL